MIRSMRKLHKWVGLVVAIQFAAWVVSGLVMSILDHNKVMGHEQSAHHVPPPWKPEGMLAPHAVLARAASPVETLDTAWLAQRQVYRLAGAGKTWLIDAVEGKLVRVTGADVAAIAKADYAGEGAPQAPVLLSGPTLEARNHTGAIWRVDFKDVGNTSFYVSDQDGRILERRNDTWRIFDFFWMLHIMDYSERKDFNHPLLVIAAIGGLWMALTGFWLLIGTFRLREFVPRRFRRKTGGNRP